MVNVATLQIKHKRKELYKYILTREDGAQGFVKHQKTILITNLKNKK